MMDRQTRCWHGRSYKASSVRRCRKLVGSQRKQCARSVIVKYQAKVVFIVVEHVKMAALLVVLKVCAGNVCMVV